MSDGLLSNAMGKEVADSANKRAISVFPFWAWLGRYLAIVIGASIYWVPMSLLIVALSAGIVGVDETLRSLVGVWTGLSWVGSVVATESDSIFGVLSLYYFYRLLKYREMFDINRSEVSEKTENWKDTAIRSVAGVGAGAIVVWAAMTSIVPVWVALLIAYPVFYFVARSLTETLHEDAEHAPWFGAQVHWKWSAWVSMAYIPYFLLEGGVTMVSTPVNLAICLIVPMLTVAYLVRRAIGVHFDDGQSMSAAEQWEAIRANPESDTVSDDAGLNPDNSALEQDGWDDPTTMSLDSSIWEFTEEDDTEDVTTQPQEDSWEYY